MTVITMARPRKNIESKEDMEALLEKEEQKKLPIEDMPLETLRDYRLYNEEARKLNKKLRVCRYPIKQCPVDLHPTQRVKFGNNDKSTHDVLIHVSNHLIHFSKKLTPGQIYDLPQCIVSYLSEKGYPVWGWVNLRDGSKETRVLTKQPRFSLTSIYAGD